MRALGFRSLLPILLGGLIACTGSDGPKGEPGDPGQNGTPGEPGDPGANALAKTSDEPAGANCANGGVKIEVGVDENGNDVLDAEEVTSTSYICDGDDGTGQNSLVKTGPEPAGANCPFGGQKIETGLDANNNNVLDASEVNAAATSYVCNLAPGGAISPSTGLVVSVKAVTTGTPVTVRFTLKDNRGFPVDLNGNYSVNTPMQPRFSLAYFTKNAQTGIVSPLVVYTKSGSSQAPTAYNPKGTTPGHGTIVENGVGAGDYTYSFPSTPTQGGAVGVVLDATKLSETHVVWIQASRQTDLNYTVNANTYFTANEPHYFVPAGGTPLVREIATQEGCDSCHAKFKPETTTSAEFHGGGRIAVGYCNVCHNPGRTSNPQADSASFVHRIHNGHNVADANLFHGIAATYPRDIADCNVCHDGAEQGAQAITNQSRLACKGCHDYVAFDSSASVACNVSPTPNAVGQDGKPVPCNHPIPQNNDSMCAGCHTQALMAEYHQPVAKPDPNNAWIAGKTNNNTHASYVAQEGFVPDGAEFITYDLKSVDTYTDTTVQPNVKRPQITFKLKKTANGVTSDVVFPTPGNGVTELIPNFVGSPSVYFTWAVPQDGITAPADFNASASGYLKKIWDGTATGTGAGTLSAPDANGYYTVKLTGVVIPASAVMLTGGLGYTYSLSTAPPLVQTNLPEFPWVPNNPPDGKAQGGLSIPAPNVTKVATGYTARRAIVENVKCKSCHGNLGVTPNFHAGQRNDGPTCSFCHTPNRASAGWSAGSKYFIHAIHGARKRSTPFTWRAVAVGQGYNEIEFPGTLNSCATCHVPGSYSFETPANLASLPNQQLTTVATGKYNSDPLTNSTYYTLSPYIVADNVKDYGAGFSNNPATGVATQAADSTLVMSPITGACSACHDSKIAIAHMEDNGGQFYQPRGQVLAIGASEQCMICHGPGRIAAIGDVHQR